MTLKEKINDLLTTLKYKAQNYPELQEIIQDINQLKQNFNSPLTVAVIGLIKAGKSTFINALMQQELLTTDEQEATYTVTKFKYSDEKYIEVEFNDGTLFKDEIERLDYWTARSNLEVNPRLNDVEVVNVYYPNELFKKMQIVDTPGFGSVYGVDSENTQKFVANVSKADLEKSTRLTENEVSQADAVICAFAGNMRKSDMNLVEGFLNSYGKIGNPSNSIGVFTKCDLFWEEMDQKPLTIVQEICKNSYMSRRDVRRVLHDLTPIIALPAQAIIHLDENVYKQFQELSHLDDGELYDELLFPDAFLDSDIENCALTFKQKEDLLDQYGKYGIFMIASLVRDGKTIEEVKSYVYECTGIAKLQDIILKHFGNRADIIKAENVLDRLEATSQKIISSTTNEAVIRVAESIYDEIDDIKTQFHCFKELNILQYFYSNPNILNEEDQEDLLHLTGEYGYSCENRLNVEEREYSVTELKNLAYDKLTKWSGKANSPFANRRERELAAVVKRSCELMYQNLQKLSEF